MPIPHMLGARPLAVGVQVLERQVQEHVKVFGRVVVGEAVGGLERVPEGLLGLQEVLVNPRPVGVVEAGRGEAGAQERELLQRQLGAIQEPLGELGIVERRPEYELLRRGALLGKGGLFPLGQLLEQLLGAVAGELLGRGGGDGENPAFGRVGEGGSPEVSSEGEGGEGGGEGEVGGGGVGKRGCQVHGRRRGREDMEGRHHRLKVGALAAMNGGRERLKIEDCTRRGHGEGERERIRKFTYLQANNIYRAGVDKRTFFFCLERVFFL